MGEWSGVRIPAGPFNDLNISFFSNMIKSIKIPKINDLELAYETGFHIGDGTMTREKLKMSIVSLITEITSLRVNFTKNSLHP